MITRMLPILLLAAVSTAFAADNNVKKYTLTKLQSVDGSDATCKQLFSDLQAYSKKTIELEFNSKGTPSEFDVKHGDQKFVNHTFKIIQQAVTDQAVTRFGMGSFDMDNKKMDYVITISADLKNPKINYLYPMIIANNASHCIFTGALKPDKETIAAFKKHIENKNLENGADLTSH